MRAAWYSSTCSLADVCSRFVLSAELQLDMQTDTRVAFLVVLCYLAVTMRTMNHQGASDAATARITSSYPDPIHQPPRSAFLALGVLCERHHVELLIMLESGLCRPDFALVCGCVSGPRPPRGRGALLG